MDEFFSQSFQNKVNDYIQQKNLINDQQKNKARIILETFGFVRDPSRPTIDIGPIKAPIQQKSSNTISSNDEVQDIYSSICIRCQSQDKLFYKVGRFDHSEIPCGIFSFTVLEKILSKSPNFCIPVPETMVFNCNFDLPMLIKNNGNSLEINQYKRGLKGLKKTTVSMMNTQEIENNKVPCPKVIIKFPGKIKRLVNKLKELPESWPETNQDAVIQRFIRPKGLRATKYRVVLKENFNPKVYIFTNRDRFDSQNDPIPHHIKTNSHLNDTEILDEIKRTVIDHKQILKLLHSNIYNPYLRSQSAAKFLDLSQASPEKMKVFELFNNDYGAAHKKKIKKFKSITMTARYTTKNEQDKCDIYEGKTQSYMKIIEMAIYIQDKINKFVLKDRILSEFVLDFLQDYKGNWYFLRIEYGKTKEISRMKLKPRIGRVDLKRYYDDKEELKNELSYFDDKRLLFPRKKSLEGRLNLSLINWKCK